MRIGIDFDNTIVSYDNVFHKVALESDLIPNDIPKSKLAVRDYLRRIDKEDIWTEMQGYVYGARMQDAEIFPGVIEFFKQARSKDIDLVIVSHKTQYPFLGRRYDLHQSAREWMLSNLRDDEGLLIESDAIFFETEKTEKARRIAMLACDYFVDDLPEIFELEQFPKITVPVLFDPDSFYTETNCKWSKIASWKSAWEVIK